LRSSRLAPWLLGAALLVSGCHGSTTESVPEASTIAKVEEQPPTTAKVEECSWCPAPDPSGTTAAQQATSPQTDLIDQLQSAAGETVFAHVSEDQMLSDIGAVCTAWKGETSLEDATARVSLARAELLEVSESEPGLAAYTQLLETLADQRCLRDPTQ